MLGCEDPSGVGSEKAPETVAVYSDDPQDPWNRIFHLLYARRVEWKVPLSRDDPVEPRLGDTQSRRERMEALNEYYTARFLSESRSVERRNAGDLPDFFFFGEIDYLLKEERYRRVVAALTSELERSAAERSPLASVLFQQDLWNRYDELGYLLNRTEDETARAKCRKLLALLGRMIARVARTPDELRAIPSNFEAVGGSFPPVEPTLFSEGSSWWELIPIVNGRNSMSHAFTAGYRRVFRSFIRIPGEAGEPECIEINVERGGVSPRRSDLPGCELWEGGLPDGAVVILMETPLALADDGELVALPLVLNLESRQIRQIRPGEDGRYGLEDLPFGILHGSRRSLLSPNHRSGGLERLAADELVPSGLSAFGGCGGGQLVPAHLTCRLCHGFEGRGVMTGVVHGFMEIQVRGPANSLQAESVIGQKRETPGYRSLRRFFSSAR